MEGTVAVGRRFGRNLRAARMQIGLSQEQLGFRAGLHRTEIGLLERGARVPRVDTLLKLAAALGVSIRCPLLDGIEWRAASSASGCFVLASPTQGVPLADRRV